MFIVVEGLDGAGKSTQVALLRQMFEQRGVESEYLHFPCFDTPIYGEMIAKFLRGELGALDQVDPYLVAMLYAGDRSIVSPKIEGWLEQKKVVIVDRYVYSNIAYQCAKCSGEEEYQKLREWIFNLEYDFNKIVRPDVTLFLDVPFAFTRKKLSEQREGDDREYLQGKSDIHEASLTLQERVREVYLRQRQEDKTFFVVDCSTEQGEMAPAEVIFDRIRRVITKE